VRWRVEGPVHALDLVAIWRVLLRYVTGLESNLTITPLDGADLGLKKVPGEAAALFRKRGVVCELPPPRPRDERRRETGID
jgi:hypothetical protein